MMNNGPILSSLEIGAVLSVIDEWAYSHFKVAQKVEHLQLAHKWVKLEDDDEACLIDVL
jgi:hypothetical protein